MNARWWLRRHLTRQGRAELWVVGRLRQARDRAVEASVRTRLEDLARRDLTDLGARFLAWDDEERRRIREELLDDLQPLYVGVPRAELLAVVREFGLRAAHLPVEVAP